MAFSWGGAMRGGLSGLLNRGRGGGGSSGISYDPRSRQRGPGEYYDPFRGGGTYVQQREPSWVEKLGPYAQILGGAAEGMWGADAQRIKLERERWEWEKEQEAKDRESDRNKTNWALSMIDTKWGRGG